MVLKFLKARRNDHRSSSSNLSDVMREQNVLPKLTVHIIVKHAGTEGNSNNSNFITKQQKLPKTQIEYIQKEER